MGTILLNSKTCFLQIPLILSTKFSLKNFEGLLKACATSNVIKNKIKIYSNKNLDYLDFISPHLEKNKDKAQIKIFFKNFFK